MSVLESSGEDCQARLSSLIIPGLLLHHLLLLLVLLSHVWLFCDSMDCSPPGSFVHGIFQGRILGWVAISSSRGSSYPGTESASPAAPVSQADPFLLSHQGSPISGLREVRSSLQSIATSPEKGGVWLVPARHCGRCFTVTTTCQQSFQTGLVKLPSQLKSPRHSQRVEWCDKLLHGCLSDRDGHRPLIWVSLKLTLSLLQAWSDLVPLIPFLFSLLWNVWSIKKRDSRVQLLDCNT